MVPKTTNGRFWLFIALAVGTGLALAPLHPGVALLVALSFLSAASVLSKTQGQWAGFPRYWLTHFALLLLGCTLLEGLFRLSEGRSALLYLVGPLIFWPLFTLADRLQPRQPREEASR